MTQKVRFYENFLMSSKNKFSKQRESLSEGSEKKLIFLSKKKMRQASHLQHSIFSLLELIFEK